MCAQRALRISGRAAGIENCRRIVGRKIGIRQIALWQAGISVRRADQVLQPTGWRIRRCIAATDEDVFEIRQAVCIGADPIPALGITDQRPGTGILQPVGQFRTGPPGVQRHDDRAQAGNGKEGDRPFRQVSHGQADTVALADAHRSEFGGKSAGRAKPGLIADPLVLVDREGMVAMIARMSGQFRQAAEGVLPDPGPDPANGHGLHLELGVRRTQQGLCLFD